LEEWINHYIFHGVEHFYLVNDNSNDNYNEIINKYANYITLYDNDISTKEVGRQMQIYEKYFRAILNESKWFAILDLDEFLYSPREINLLKVIDIYDKFSQITVNFLHFGSNGHISQPSSVVESFVKRAHIFDTRAYFSYKSIIKGSSLISFEIHFHYVSGEEIYLKYEENDVPDLVINHYCIQSQDFFMKIKATRGDCDNYIEQTNRIRDLDYFKGYDINDIFDDRLYIQNKDIIHLPVEPKPPSPLFELDNSDSSTNSTKNGDNLG